VFTVWQQWMKATQLAFDVQSVIGLRMMRIAEGGPFAAAEAQRMITEKVAALAAAQGAGAVTLMCGGTPARAAARAITPVRRRVRANHRRLRRRRLPRWSGTK
jgi:hypothetical protein